MACASDRRSSTGVLDDPALVYIRENVTGRNSEIVTPFGTRRLRYFDYAASGLPFDPIERVISEQVLPWMANTHTEGNYTGHRMTFLVHEARRKIADCLGARDDDVVLFTGNGSTGAINHLIQAMGLRIPDQVQEFCGCRTKLPIEMRPIVFRSRMEHHSNDISWRESLASTRFVGFDRQGRIDWRDLERQLAEPDVLAHPLRIGTFSAASNVTGIINDVDALAEVMHAAGGRAFFDYAAAAPYLPIELHPDGPEGRRKDAVFISTHKFLGGPQTPGILAAGRSLFTNKVPVVPGGGTVLFTSPWDCLYQGELEMREEGGTPPIVQIIRAGLVFSLKRAMGQELIGRAEQELVGRARARITANPDLVLLGSHDGEQLGIFSVIFCGGRLHHKLAVRLLNDLFGIQVRSGCMCAGTYGHDLLGLSEEQSRSISCALDCGDQWARPGWVRISISPATSPEDLEYLLEAMDTLAREWTEYEHLYSRDASGEYSWCGPGYEEKFAFPDLGIEGGCPPAE